jgi:cytoskeletal protein CcmA (bactofilin family)
MTAPVIQFKRGLLANLPGLRAGEPGFTTDSYDLFVGLTSETSTNKFFGSHRYWTKETESTGSGLNLVEGTSNGSDYITIQSPNSLAGIVTYILPGVQGAVQSVLTNDGSGNLTWASGSLNAVFSGITTIGGDFLDVNVDSDFAGITTFSNTTDNTLGDPNTGAVQIDGGLGVDKNVTIGAGLSVSGESYFIGTATFYGGTLNLGDSDGDNINVAGEFVSNLTPNADNTYDIGDNLTPKRWRHAAFSGVGTFATGAVVDAIQIGISGASEIDTSSGGLTLDSASGQITIDDDLSVTGVSTFTGLVDANGGLDVTGQVAFNNDLSVTGVSTFTGLVDSNGGLDVTGQTTLNNDLSVTGVSTFTGAIDANGGLDITGQVAFNNNLSVTGVSTFTGLVDANGGLDVTGQVAFNNNLSVTGVSTFTGAIDANAGLDVSGGETILSSATVSDLTQGRVVLAGAAGSLEDSANLTFGAGGLIVGAGGINVTGVSTFSTDLVVGGDVTVTGNDIKASDGNTNITLSSNTLTTFAGDIKVTGNDIQASDGTTAITMASANVTVAGDLTVGGNDIKASDGTTALTLANSTGAVTTSNDLTVSGNLYVSGNTTQVNTAALTVEDRTIDLGIVNGATPASSTTWDLGVLFNYHAGGSAKKSAVIWEHGDTRFKFASVLTSDTDGSDNSTPQLSVTTFAPIEIGALWVSDCAGTSQVISCTGTERFLENITIDAGTF